MRKRYSFILILFLGLIPFYKVMGQVNADFVINYQYPNCSPTVITFVNNSTGLAPLTYDWDFGIPGLTSNQSNPSTTYSDCGTYTVKLTVTNGIGQKSIKTKTV